MTGAFLIGFVVIVVIAFLIWRFGDTYNEEVWGGIAVVAAIIVVILLISIPCNRIDTKQKAEYARVFQETLDYNRTIQGDFTVLERTAVIDEINDCNNHIIGWRIKGQKWYYNKWYYHEDTQKAELIK